MFTWDHINMSKKLLLKILLLPLDFHNYNPTKLIEVGNGCNCWRTNASESFINTNSDRANQINKFKNMK